MLARVADWSKGPLVPASNFKPISSSCLRSTMCLIELRKSIALCFRVSPGRIGLGLVLILRRARLTLLFHPPIKYHVPTFVMVIFITTCSQTSR